MTKPALTVVRGLSNDLPPKWDGRTVEWEGWEPPIFICPPLPDHERACDQCGTIDSKQSNTGRIHTEQGIDLLIASRCQHCNHDTVYEATTQQVWDLDPSDYSDDGSYELGQGSLL